MAYIENIRNNNGDIKLTNMNEKVFNIFDLLGFPLLYEIFKTEEEAVTKFNKSTGVGSK
jgi:anti-sigma B factor antagonist